MVSIHSEMGVLKVAKQSQQKLSSFDQRWVDWRPPPGTDPLQLTMGVQDYQEVCQGQAYSLYTKHHDDHFCSWSWCSLWLTRTWSSSLSLSQYSSPRFCRSLET